MKNRILIGVITLGVFAILTTRCSKVPQADMDAANTAIDSAKTVGAEMYLPDAFAGLQDSMKVITEKIEVQKTKMFRNYSEVKEKLAAVTTLANQVAEQTEVRKNEVKTEVENTLTTVKTILEENKQLVTKAPRGKEGAAALEAIKNDINAIETSLNEVPGILESGDYISALDKVKAANEKASSINAELKEAIAKKRYPAP